MSEEGKKFRSKYFYAAKRTSLPLNPIMPAKYSAKKRAELREFEKEVFHPTKDDENEK